MKQHAAVTLAVSLAACATALALYAEADRWEARAGTAVPSDRTLLMRGGIYRRQGTYDRAAEQLRTLLERGEARHDPGLLATAAHHLAWVDLARGAYGPARRLCGHALALYQTTGDARGEADAYEQLGVLALASGNAPAAVRDLLRSLALRRRIGNRHGAASSWRRLALAHLRDGHLRRAAGALLTSLILYQRLGMLTPARLGSIGRELWHLVVRPALAGRRRHFFAAMSGQPVYPIRPPAARDRRPARTRGWRRVARANR